MTPETISRQPQEGTGRFKVFQAIKEKNIPSWDTGRIVIETGLPRRTVAVALGNLRRDGYLAKPTTEDSRKSRRLAGSKVLLPVKPYREMGMSIREIVLAVKTEQGIDFSMEQVNGALSAGNRSRSLRRLSNEEKQDIRRDAAMLSDEEILDRVVDWFKVRDWIGETGARLPDSRIEWKSLIESMNRARYVIPISLRGVQTSVALTTSEKMLRIKSKSGDGFVLDDSEKDILFASRLLKEGIIDEDLSSFYVLRNLDRGRDIELAPLSVEVQLRLEAFVKSLMQELRGSTVLREHFKEIGEGIDRKWFYNRLSAAVEQQILIREKLSRNGFKKNNGDDGIGNNTEQRMKNDD